jgi:23S rRNA (uracil1939-C5)-methyltransferase
MQGIIKGDCITDGIESDLTFGEQDAASVKTRTADEEIKEYVRKETCLKVSGSYIFQIKRKCRLEAGENNNLPQSESVRVPPSTGETLICL